MNGKKWLVGSLIAIVVVVVVLLVSGNYLYHRLFSHLPEQRPEDLTVQIDEGGGMLDESTSYTIANGVATFTDHSGSSDITVQVDLTDQDLDYVWNQLKNADFDLIQQHEDGEVYDRGGTTIQVSYGDITITKADAGSSFITSGGKWFYMVATRITGMIDQKLRDMNVLISGSQDAITITQEPTLIYPAD